jgi:GNAT superfamily N-acetyltransferase
MSLVARPATAATVRPLRNRVLRPTKQDTPAYDADPTAVHLAAIDGDVVVGCATVFPDPYDGEPAAWHLRGMAVDPARQGEGIGTVLLEAAAAVALAAGAPLLWAEGRVSALGFYQRLGWRVVGVEFIHPDSGLAHQRIVRDVR